MLGTRYTFSAVGEYRLVQTGEFEIQVRQAARGGGSQNTAFEAMFYNSGARIGMYPRAEGTVIRVFDSQAALLSASGASQYSRLIEDVRVDCTFKRSCRLYSTSLDVEVTASVWGGNLLNMNVAVGASMRNETRGLCASYNGDASDDEASVSYTRVTRDESIMWYDPPNTWETYNKPPDGYTPSDECETSELEDAATTACADTAECNMLEECIADVCATGDINAAAGMIEACQSRKKAEDRLKDRTDGDGTTTAGPTTTLGPLTTPQPPQPPVFPPRPPIVSPVSPNRGKQLHLVCVFVMGCWDLIFIFLF